MTSPTATNGCPTCKMIWALLQIHARQCRITNHCPVPRCRDLKAHLRRMRMDQRKRDNRRRQAFETGKWWGSWILEWLVRCADVTVVSLACTLCFFLVLFVCSVFFYLFFFTGHRAHTARTAQAAAQRAAESRRQVSVSSTSSTGGRSGGKPSGKGPK